MKVLYGSVEYRVNFRKVHKGEGLKHGIDTTCTISQVIPTRAGDKPDFHELGEPGVARHNPKDRYDKVRGKRIALGRALKKAGFQCKKSQEAFLSQFSEDFEG